MVDKIRDILIKFNIYIANEIKQVYNSAWNVDDTYIMKRNKDYSQLEKSIALSSMLTNEMIPVAKLYKTVDEKSYVFFDGEYYYCLMSKLSGQHIDPYVGDCSEMGRRLGKAVATLHIALKKIESSFECYDSDLMKELDGWIMHEIREKNLSINQEIIDKCYEFKDLYSRLPRQLIHRDIHTGNLLFEDGDFVGYLDFDISQKNIHVFDICYLGAGLLVENYQDKSKFYLWQKIFRGIIEGYEEISSLSSDEKQAIPIMFVMIELLLTAYFSMIGQAETSKSCIDMTSWLYHNLDKIQSITNH